MKRTVLCRFCLKNTARPALDLNIVIPPQRYIVRHCLLMSVSELENKKWALCPDIPPPLVVRTLFNTEVPLLEHWVYNYTSKKKVNFYETSLHEKSFVHSFFSDSSGCGILFIHSLAQTRTCSK